MGTVDGKSALCCATGNSCGACGNCEIDVGTTRDGVRDVCTDVDGSVSWHGACTRDMSAWFAEAAKLNSSKDLLNTIESTFKGCSADLLVLSLCGARSMRQNLHA